MAVAVLDMNNSNPWSRLPLSEFISLESVRNWVKRFVKSSKNAPSVPKKLSRVVSKTSRCVSILSACSVNFCYHVDKKKDFLLDRIPS